MEKLYKEVIQLKESIQEELLLLLVLTWLLEEDKDQYILQGLAKEKVGINLSVGLHHLMTTVLKEMRKQLYLFNKDKRIIRDLEDY